MKNKEQSHPSSVDPAVHHQTLQASSGFPLPVSEIIQRVLHKQAQTSNITNLFKFITTIRLDLQNCKVFQEN